MKRGAFVAGSLALGQPAGPTWFTSKTWLTAHPADAVKFARIMRDGAQWAPRMHASRRKSCAA